MKFVRKLQLMDVQDKLDLNDAVIYGFNFNIILVTSDVANSTYSRKNLRILTPFPCIFKLYSFVIQIAFPCRRIDNI